VSGTNGTLVFTNPNRLESDEPSVTASQTIFTLTSTPVVNSRVLMFINGIRISRSAYSLNGSTVTYDPSVNGNYSIKESDRVQFDYLTNDIYDPS